ncbi:group II intron maturase-specific domain-containing protein [Thiolapillus sp.]
MSLRSEHSLDDLARMMAPRVRGWIWINYYYRFRGSEFQAAADRPDCIIVRLVMRKHKHLRGHK